MNIKNIKFDMFLCVFLVLGLFLNLFHFSFSTYLLITVNFLSLLPVILSAFKALKNKEVTVDLLAVIALTFSFISKEWSSAAFINLMITSARIFSKWTEMKTENALNSLLKYRIDIVKVKNGDGYLEKKTKELSIGDIIIVGPGERIATDGIVASGSSAVDDSTITGESIPRSVSKGDLCYASSLNISSVIEIKVTKTEEENTLSKIILAVQEATLKKSRIIKTSSKFASWYVGLTLIVSIIIYLVTRNEHFTLAVLLVVCADDLAVSIPLAFTMGLSKATKNGILIKSSDVLEKIPKLKYIITDKTGTLTKSKIEITEVINLSKIKESKIYKIIGSLVLNSSHPVSKALLEFVKSKGVKATVNETFKDYPGEGGLVEIGNDKYMIGKISFLKKMNVKISKNTSKLILSYQNKGLSISAVSKNKDLISLVVFQDEIKSNISTIINKTKQMGILKWIMLTGDNKQISENVAETVGIDDYVSDLKPETKLDFIESLKRKDKGLIAMIGDGVNDAPSLAMADVSFAMGAAGSDTAIKVSDVAIMNDNLDKIPSIISLAKNVNNIVSQNIIFWVVSNLFGLILVVTGVLGPTGAATYNFVTDFFTTMNSLRVGFNKKK